MELYQRAFTPPEKSFFLLGPRGTGKSTLMRMLFQDALWLDLLKPDVFRTYLAKPERLFDLANASSKNEPIIIDEIQKIPSLLTVVHSLIETSPGRQFILTGSSARKIKRSGADLLAGRALNCSLHPFMACELGANFNLPKALKQGMLPIIQNDKTPQLSLQSYVNLYLLEEIQVEGLVRNLDSFARFMEIISFSHGSLLNVSNIARECEVKRKTVENYIQILEDLLLAFTLPVFTKRAQREMVAHPKFYLFDAGVYHTIRPQGQLDRPEEVGGAALEGLVAQHLLAWNAYSAQPVTISYWRTRAGLEIDFIVYGPQGLHALEVKHSSRVDRHDLKSLQAFKIDYPMAQCFLLYQGTEQLMIEGILCLPCDMFLKQLRPDKPLFD
ncbi:MAG: AAA family ATPase [Gammaproteobacteria bacterium]|nr:AAA family ATPase [Gammaproteobacteria bacterium]